MSDAPNLIRREIAGVPIRDLTRDFGTPTYVYDGGAIARRIAEFSDFDVLRFAQKANSNLAVLDLCRRHGVVVDAVSAGEIHRALRAGYAAQGEPPPIYYTSDVFDRDALEAVVEHGIAVNCGSPEMIDQYGARVGSGEITLRINPGFGHGHSQKTNTGGEHSKHGIWHEELESCVERAHAHGLRVSGIHVHIGSGADMEHLARVAGAAAGFARRVGPEVRMMSAGGGLQVPVRPGEARIDLGEYFRTWDAERKQLERAFGHPIRLEIEPGRYLVAEAGFLLSEILAVKQMGRNRFYLVDAGFNTLARPILYGAYHPMSLAPARDREAGAVQDVVVGGPLCESGDIFTQNEGGIVRTQPLPQAEVGDTLVIELAGAYGFVMGSNYNTRPLAAEVLITGSKAHGVRTRQRVEDLTRGETIPVE